MEFEILPAYDRIDVIRGLFREYAQLLNIDLSFQNYEEELERLPGYYTPPRGRLYAAYCGCEPAGCIALRPFDREKCEMKRLYVRPEFREKGIGKSLALKIISDAREEKYAKMVLDTLDTLKSAMRLYETLGFYTTKPYYHNPCPGSVYMCLDL